MIYRNVIITNCSMYWSIFAKFPIILKTSYFNRESYALFGVNLTPKPDAIQFIYNNSGYLIIDSDDKQKVVNGGDISCKKDESFSIETKIEGLTKEQELAFIIKFGAKEDITFDG
jgi:hypothetical protein